MDRRKFLTMFGGGVVASATMAEAGFFADFMAWLKRMPTWSIPANPACSVPSLGYLATIYYDRKALDALKDNFVFDQANSAVWLPKESGKVMTMYAH